MFWCRVVKTAQRIVKVSKTETNRLKINTIQLVHAASLFKKYMCKLWLKWSLKSYKRSNSKLLPTLLVLIKLISISKRISMLCTACLLPLLTPSQSGLCLLESTKNNNKIPIYYYVPWYIWSFCMCMIPPHMSRLAKLSKVDQQNSPVIYL